MKTARSIYDCRAGKAIIQRSGEDIFTSDRRVFLIKNSRDISRYLDNAQVDKKDLVDGRVYGFGYEKGSKGYKGFFNRSQNVYADNFLSDFLSSLNKDDLELSIGETFKLSNCSESILKLHLENKGDISVQKVFHDYLVRNTGADKFLASFPVVYMRGCEVVGSIAPMSLFFGKKGGKVEMDVWFERVYGKNKVNH